MSETRAANLACALLLIGAVLLVFSTYQDFGMTWDEGVQSQYGGLVLDYFASGGEDRSASTFLDLRFYGPLFEAALALLPKDTVSGHVALRHLVTALFGLLGAFAVMQFARRLEGSAWLAPMAGLALLSMPRFWGHLFGNSKDIPFATAFALSMWVLSGWVAHRELPWRKTLSVAFVFGFTAALRPGGLPMLLAVAGIAVLASIAREQSRQDGDEGMGLWEALVQGALRGGVILCVAWLLMVLAWPWAHEAPIAHPFEAMTQAAAFSQSYPVLFEGAFVPSDTLPLRYLFQFIGITTPLVTLGLAGVGLWAAIDRQRAAPSEAVSMRLLVLELWLFVPLLVYVVLRPNVYDGIRHFLFVLPAIAVLAALGVSWLAERGQTAGAGRAVWALAGLLLLWPVGQSVKLHPYSTSYFNALVGGLAGAEGRYETDYWVSSYKEATEWLNARAEEGGGKRLRVAIAANEWSLPCAQSYASRAVEFVPIFGRAQAKALPVTVDYYLSTYRYGFSQNFADAPVVHTVEREGAVLTLIRGHSDGYDDE